MVERKQYTYDPKDETPDQRVLKRHRMLKAGVLVAAVLVVGFGAGAYTMQNATSLPFVENVEPTFSQGYCEEMLRHALLDMERSPLSSAWYRVDGWLRALNTTACQEAGS